MITLDRFDCRPAVRALLPRLVHWRRSLHQQPELGFEEHRTATLIARELGDLGLSPRTGVAGTGVVCTIEGDRPGPVIGIRADMDALPIQEENAVEYRSRIPERMHACGHDGHVAIALGLADHLSRHRDFAGTVKLIFQPAEEGPGGAGPMVAAGALENPTVEAIFGLHLWNFLPLGTVAVRPGPLMAAVELFDLTIHGKGGHGAMPQHSVDAVLTGAQVVTALQAVVARNVDPLRSAVLTVGAFQAGEARNVIADRALLRGTVRYFDPDFAGFFEGRIRAVAEGICAGAGAHCDLNYWSLYPPLVNDPAMAALVQRVAGRLLPPEAIAPDYRTMCGEDMGLFLQQVPGCFFFLGAANLERGLDFPHHHPRFDFDESALAMGVELFLRILEAYPG